MIVFWIIFGAYLLLGVVFLAWGALNLGGIFVGVNILTGKSRTRADISGSIERGFKWVAIGGSMLALPFLIMSAYP